MRDLQVGGIIQINITEDLKKGKMLKDSVIIIEMIEIPEIKEIFQEITEKEIEIAETTENIETTVSSEKIGATNMTGDIKIENTTDMKGVTIEIDHLMIGIMSIGRENIPGIRLTMRPGTRHIMHLTMLETHICKVPALANSVVKGQDTEMALPETLQVSKGIKASQSLLNVVAVEGHAAEINEKYFN
jgi:hypothetical protein